MGSDIVITTGANSELLVYGPFGSPEEGEAWASTRPRNTWLLARLLDPDPPHSDIYKYERIQAELAQVMEVQGDLSRSTLLERGIGWCFDSAAAFTLQVEHGLSVDNNVVEGYVTVTTITAADLRLVSVQEAYANHIDAAYANRYAIVAAVLMKLKVEHARQSD